MRTLILLAILAVLLPFESCKKKTVTPDLTPKKIELSAKGAEVIAVNNAFGIALFTGTAAEESENLMVSPLSASTALCMLLNGCGGNTFTQIKEMLGYPETMSIAEINEAYRVLVGQLLNADPKVNLALANAIFYRSGFNVKQTFLNIMQSEFEARIEGLDFSSPSALTTINKWASDNTNGKINKVLDEISGDAVMFLMNALYFKGDWTYKFDPALTDDRQFLLDNGTSADVPTMNGEVGSKCAYGDGYKAIELPYGRTNFTMVIIVPDTTLSGFYNGFTDETWAYLTSTLDGYLEYGSVEVSLPKFKFSYEKCLNDQLKAMGMLDAFNPSLADLSGIADASIYVNFVKQNTFVDVNEEGTEAAAVTTIGIDATSMPEPTIFIVDKPFVFAIRERTTNTLMFIGQVTDPR